MAFGAGLRIVRVEGDGENQYPVWTDGPQLPKELRALCVERNASVRDTEDQFVVHDEEGNIFS
jgi:hypothetical protein